MGNYSTIPRMRPGSFLRCRVPVRFVPRYVQQLQPSLHPLIPCGQAAVAAPKRQLWTPDAGIIFDAGRAMHTTAEAMVEEEAEAVAAEVEAVPVKTLTSPPETTLAYKMSQEAFDKARSAAEGSAESFWSYAQYRHEESGAQVRVHYCRSRQTTERVCREYFVGEAVLGLDLEWMPDAMRWQDARRNVCVVQLASPSHVGIFHLAVFPASEGTGADLVPPALRQVLEDSDTLKAGVWIRGDATRLRKFLKVDARGIFELSQLHNLVKYSQAGQPHRVNKRLVALAAQVKEHLGLPLFKGPDVRSSDWSQPLNLKQVLYSASDVYASVQLFSALERKRESLVPTPPRPAYAELLLPIQLAGETAAALVDEVSDEFPDSEPEDSDAKPPMTPQPVCKKGSPAPLKDGRIVAANEWLAEYRQSTSAVHKKSRARPSSLRAYRLWHHHGELDPVALAGLLREPPLQTNTVVGYILEAVRIEGLPYDKARLRTELLDKLPAQVTMMRYRNLARDCGLDNETA